MLDWIDKTDSTLFWARVNPDITVGAMEPQSWAQTGLYPPTWFKKLIKSDFKIEFRLLANNFAQFNLLTSFQP